MAFEITLTGTRGDEWQRAIGKRTFPVTSEFPELAAVFGNPEVLVFMLDLTQLDARTRDRITHYLAEKFGRQLDQIRHEIKVGGVPILAVDLVTPTGMQI